MPARWQPGRQLSYDDFKAQALATPPAGAVIVADEHAIPGGLGSFFVVLRKKSAVNDQQLAFTSPYKVDNPARKLSATTVDSWCGTLGLDPNAFGVDDVR